MRDTDADKPVAGTGDKSPIGGPGHESASSSSNEPRLGHAAAWAMRDDEAERRVMADLAALLASLPPDESDEPPEAAPLPEAEAEPLTVADLAKIIRAELPNDPAPPSEVVTLPIAGADAVMVDADAEKLVVADFAKLLAAEPPRIPAPQPEVVTDPAAEAAKDELLRLTYRELGERLGMSADGARALTRRKRWPIIRDDNGRSLVSVAASELAQQAERRAPHDPAASPAAERKDARSMAARVAEMVAAIKAEPPPAGALTRVEDNAERERLVRLMHQFLAMYERERVSWFSAISEFSGKLDNAREELRMLLDRQEHEREQLEEERARQEQERAHWEQTLDRAETAMNQAVDAAKAAEGKLEQTVVQHQRGLSDLNVMHNDQRSLWLLERRRLEMTIDAYEKDRDRGWLADGSRPFALLRAAAVVVIVVLAGIALARDTGPTLAPSQGYDRNGSEYWRQVVHNDGNEATSAATVAELDR